MYLESNLKDADKAGKQASAASLLLYEEAEQPSVQNIAVDEDISKAIWTCMGYTVLLCFTLFKTSSMAKSIFNAH